jgi:hypothetical protein
LRAARLCWSALIYFSFMNARGIHEGQEE